MRAFVYSDGFNFYYGAVRGTPYKWLDVNRMCQLLLPHDEIAQIRYFHRARKPATQRSTTGAASADFHPRLEAFPNISIHYGSFLANPVTLPLANPTRRQRTARVIRTEEKGSDVNLASMLLVDGFRKRYEVAVVISNDSDLVLPISIVRDELGLPVGVVNPRGHPSYELRRVASFFKRIRKGILEGSQLPPTLTDERGTITKPTKWERPG